MSAAGALVGDVALDSGSDTAPCLSSQQRVYQPWVNKRDDLSSQAIGNTGHEWRGKDTRAVTAAMHSMEGIR